MRFPSSTRRPDSEVGPAGVSAEEGRRQQGTPGGSPNRLPPAPGGHGAGASHPRPSPGRHIWGACDNSEPNKHPPLHGASVQGAGANQAARLPALGGESRVGRGQSRERGAERRHRNGQSTWDEGSRCPREVKELAKQPSEKAYSGENSGSAKALRPEAACSG